MSRLLICGRFIKEDQLFALPFADLAQPVVPELLASLCSATLKLETSAKRGTRLREKYHFTRPFPFPEQTANSGLGDKYIERIPDKINHLVALCIGLFH
jgi:hypothetical protein